MPTSRDMLILQTAQAFDGRPDMSLLSALKGIGDDEAAWQPDRDTPSIEQIVRHVAWAKSRFCQQGFGGRMALNDVSVDGDGDCPSLSQEFPCGAGWGLKAAGGIAGAIELLEQSHQRLAECLLSCNEESLDAPLAARHGKSAANFFTVMLMHDLYHAGQIRTRRTFWRIARL